MSGPFKIRRYADLLDGPRADSVEETAGKGGAADTGEGVTVENAGDR